jgi:hypothetical protein
MPAVSVCFAAPHELGRNIAPPFGDARQRVFDASRSSVLLHDGSRPAELLGVVIVVMFPP